MYNVINYEHVDSSNMFSYIVDINNLYQAYKNACKGKLKFKKDAMLFTSTLSYSLRKLREDILTGKYRARTYRYAVIADTKRREIFIPQFIDKVAQHALNNILREFYEPKFIHDSYACIRGKGNEAAVKRIQEFFRESMKFYKDPCLIKLDISKFFYTIDKDVLMDVIRKDITCVRTLNFIEAIVRSFHPRHKGLPLGNLTSQQFANILLHQVDKVIKHSHKVKYYVRYADDMFLIVDGKEKASKIMHKVIEFINRELKLICNPVKCYIHELRKIKKDIWIRV